MTFKVYKIEWKYFHNKWSAFEIIFFNLFALLSLKDKFVINRIGWNNKFRIINLIGINNNKVITLNSVNGEWWFNDSVYSALQYSLLILQVYLHLADDEG